MKYSITCVCGEKISIESSSEEEAISKMLVAMDAHVTAKEHPEIPKDLTQEQKVGMVKQQMIKE